MHASRRKSPAEVIAHAMRPAHGMRPLRVLGQACVQCAGQACAEALSAEPSRRVRLGRSDQVELSVPRARGATLGALAPPVDAGPCYVVKRSFVHVLPSWSIHLTSYDATVIGTALGGNRSSSASRAFGPRARAGSCGSEGRSCPAPDDHAKAHIPCRQG